MKILRDLVLRCLHYYKDDDKLISKLNQLIKKNGNLTYQVIFQVLTNLDLELEEAEKCWNEIILHHDNLALLLGRKISLRTTICDYFCSIQKSLTNPKVVEIHIFEKTLKDSQYDGLTGLFNRHYLDEILKKEIARAKRHQSELSILLVDIDDFKKVNDTYGHQAGDFILKQIAKIILDAKRVEDIAGRYGGEELLLILPEVNKFNALVFAERIRKKIYQSKIKYEGHVINITISGGLATFPINSTQASKLLKCADNALYRAKGSGKNNISFSSDDKRRYLRFDFTDKIQVREFGFDEFKTLTTRGKNLGIGGILFETEYPMEIGKKIQLSIPIYGDDPLFVIGTVVRVETFGPKRYDIGVEISFLELDKNIKREISKWLQLKR